MNRSAARLFVKFLELLPRPGDAAKAQVARRCVDRLRHARRRPVAPAIVRRAQVRSAFHDFAWYAAAPAPRSEPLFMTLRGMPPPPAGSTKPRPLAAPPRVTAFAEEFPARRWGWFPS